jgi:hypothetical protein
VLRNSAAFQSIGFALCDPLRSGLGNRYGCGIRNVRTKAHFMRCSRMECIGIFLAAELLCAPDASSVPVVDEPRHAFLAIRSLPFAFADRHLRQLQLDARTSKINGSFQKK